jgi:putative heme-binding domain-containing protein
LAVVHPDAEIREGFETVTVLTDEGQVLSGLKVDEDPQRLVLRSADGQTTSIPTDQIEERLSSPNSLMPRGLLDGLSDSEIRDLFAFLTSTTPPN